MKVIRYILTLTNAQAFGYEKVREYSEIFTKSDNWGLKSVLIQEKDILMMTITDIPLHVSRILTKRHRSIMINMASVQIQ